VRQLPSPGQAGDFLDVAAGPGEWHARRLGAACLATLTGVLLAGGGALLRFGKTVGVNIQLDFDWMFPSSYQNFDLSAGLQLTF